MRISDWSSDVCSSDLEQALLPQGSVVNTHLAATPEPMWERACSRRRRHIQHVYWLTHRFREQALLPQGSVVNTHLAATPEPLWERACSRRRRHIQHVYWLTHRFREQRSEEHTSELQSLMRISYAVFCLKKK